MKLWQRGMHAWSISTPQPVWVDSVDSRSAQVYPQGRGPLHQARHLPVGGALRLHPGGTPKPRPQHPSNSIGVNLASLKKTALTEGQIQVNPSKNWDPHVLCRSICFFIYFLRILFLFCNFISENALSVVSMRFQMALYLSALKMNIFEFRITSTRTSRV